jgi:hypothetical protein
MGLYEIHAKKDGRAERIFDFRYDEPLKPGLSIYDSGTIYKIVSVKPRKASKYAALVTALWSHSFRA